MDTVKEFQNNIVKYDNLMSVPLHNKISRVSNKLRVVHIPQVGSSVKCFYIDVADEIEAAKISNVIAMQHNWLYENNFIPDFANIITVEMYNSDSKEWENYFNEEECMEWEEYEEHLSKIIESLNLQQNY